MTKTQNPILTEQEYDAAIAELNALLDAGGADEEHELAPRVQALAEVIGAYEDVHYPADERAKR